MVSWKHKKWQLYYHLEWYPNIILITGGCVPCLFLSGQDRTPRRRPEKSKDSLTPDIWFEEDWPERHKGHFFQDPECGLHNQTYWYWWWWWLLLLSLLLLLVVVYLAGALLCQQNYLHAVLVLAVTQINFILIHITWYIMYSYNKNLWYLRRHGGRATFCDEFKVMDGKIWPAVNHDKEMQVPKTQDILSNNLVYYSFSSIQHQVNR